MPEPISPSYDPLEHQMVGTIDQHAMLASGDKVLVGVSGGPDSVALAHALRTLSDHYGITLAIAHLDHSQRPETALLEMRFVQDLADRLDVICHCGKIEKRLKSGSLEEQLREHRYAFFRSTAEKLVCTKIAVGHQAEDNAEAVLINLLRGSGIQGLSGIQPVREGRIIRPLIQTRRAQIMAYLEKHHLKYIEDPSNDQWRFRRNRIRHHLLPILEKDYNPNIVETLNRMATICRDDETEWKERLQPLLKAAIIETTPRQMSLSAEILNERSRSVQRRLLRLALRQWLRQLRRFGAGHIEDVVGLLEDNRTNHQLHLPQGVLVLRTPTALRFVRMGNLRHLATDDRTAEYRYTICASEQWPQTIDIIEAGIRMRFELVPTPDHHTLKSPRKDEIYLDVDALSFPLTIRNRLPGDRLKPFGMNGTQSIKRLFINQKVPQSLRRQTPLMVDGKEVLWAVGVRRSGVAAVTAQTVQVLRVSVAPLTSG